MFFVWSVWGMWRKTNASFFESLKADALFFFFFFKADALEMNYGATLWESRLSLVFQPFSRFSVYFLFYFIFSRRHKSIGWILGSFPTLKVPYAKCGPNTASIRGVLFLTTSSSFHAVAGFPSGASTWIERKTNWSNSSMKLAFSGPVPGKQSPSPGLVAALREAISSSDPSPEYLVEACGIKPG